MERLVSAFSIAGMIFLDITMLATSFPFAGIISLCALLHLLITLHDYGWRVWNFLETIFYFVSSWQYWCNNKKADNRLGREEVEMVMKKLGISCHPPNGEEVQEGVGLEEVETLFEDEEVGLDEVREAFGVFDENCDGFIEANELEKVICALGFSEVSKAECEKMIRGFDSNGDGRIDFGEFSKILENCPW